MTYTMIKTDDELGEYRRHLDSNSIRTVAMDFEGEFNLHVYGKKLCLIQVFDGSRFFLIDPFRISSQELAAVLGDKLVMKLFYGAESDIALVSKQYGIQMKSVYDLKLLADLFDFPGQGLDNILSGVLGLPPTNKKKYQQYNWTLRPIKEDALQYALSDVAHLFELKDRLTARLLADNRLDDLIRNLVCRDTDFKKNPVPRIKRSRRYEDLRSEEKKRFDRLLNIREEHAKNLNCPPNNLITKDQLFDFAKSGGNIRNLPLTNVLTEKMRNRIEEEFADGAREGAAE
jgi:ribonuclease D